MKHNYLLFCAFFLYLFGNAQPYITTSTTEYTQEELVTQVLINSPCAIVENVVGTTGIDFGSLNGIGYFENTNPVFPLNDGVILMTAGVNQAPGPNNSPQDAGDWPGDAQLFNYIQSLGIDPGLTSYNDASILEFDFKPLTDSISFNFVFASNEYGTFQCSYSDAFAFFLTNEDTNEVINLAIVPGTADPISVITIRDQLYNNSCGSVNPEYFDNYYGTPNGLPNAQSPINFNGHTVLMQAWSYVEPNTQYRMKLVIADRNDSSFNSAVFIEGGSFFIGGTDLGEDLTIANGTAPCDTEEVILSVNTSEGSVITWFFNGDVIPGEDGPTLLVTEPGLYGVEIINPDAPACLITDEILIEFKTTAIVDLGDDIIECEQVSVQLDATPENLGSLGSVTYEWFFNGVLIPGENNATLDVTEIGEYTVEVTTDLGCITTDSISVEIADFTVDLGVDVSPCENSTYEIVPDVQGIDPTEATYLWSTGETTFSIFVTASGNYSVEVTYFACVETDDVNVNFAELPIVDLGENFETCFDEVTILDATPSNYDPELATYQWFLNGDLLANNQVTIEISEYGTYSVIVTVEGCIGEDSVNVSPSEDLIVSLGENILGCTRETRTLIATTSEEGVTFAWFLNGTLITGETSNTLEITLPVTESSLSDVYRVEITKGECSGFDESEVFAQNCVISQGISPNGDGLNDCFDIEFLNNESSITKLSIFNRYGTVVYEQENYTNQWCGQSSNGDVLPVGNYFYVITLLDESPKTGFIYLNK